LYLIETQTANCSMSLVYSCWGSWTRWGWQASRCSQWRSVTEPMRTWCLPSRPCLSSSTETTLSVRPLATSTISAHR